MKRIYKNNDLAFNLTINNFPINKDLINSIEFKFYTLNQSNYILKTQDDIDVYNQVILEWSELRKLEEGVLFYDYNVSLKNEEMNDGTEDTVNKIMTNYYIVTGNETIDINSDMANYYTKDEIDDLIANVEGGEVDLTKYYTKSQIDIKLNGYVQDDVLGSYYTKNEVNDLIDNIEIPTGVTNFDSTQYYTKTEVNNLIPKDYLTEIPSEFITETELNNSLSGYAKLTDIPTDYIKSIPSEYITESELNDKGYLTQHQSLTNYYTKEEIDEKIPSDYIKAVNIGRNDDENFQVEDGVVNIYTEFYDGGYDMNIDSRSVFGIKPMDDTITLENVGGTGNGNFRCGIKINDNVINRISILESELTGVSEQITELNNMVV